MHPTRESNRTGLLFAAGILLLVSAFTARLGVDSWMVPTAAAAPSEGQRLFDHETFGGNGRTCRTCHSGSDGTIDPQEVAERLADPSDPLFVHDGLDDFVSGTSRIAAHATILIERELPPGVVLVDDPSATSVVLARGVPTTVNTPALDAALMYDLRDLNLRDQASGAIDRHAQAAIPPTADQLEAIAAFQQTDSRFFSSKALKRVRGRRPRTVVTGRAHRVGETRPRVLRGRALESAEQEGRLRAVPQRTDAEHRQRVRDDSNRGAAGMARIRHRGQLPQSAEPSGSHLRGHRSL